MNDVLIASTVALTVGIVWAIRQTGFVSDRFVPISSIVIGCGWAFLLGASGLAQTLSSGVMIGLMACGTWSGSKTLILGSRTE